MGATRRSFMQAAAVSAALGASAQAGAAAGRIKVGQIGSKHAHAAGKIATLRKFSDLYDVVGVVEPDAKRRAAVENTPAYRGVRWLTEEQLLNTHGLQAVAVETEVRDLIATGKRCVAADLHIHLDKPAGVDLVGLQQLLADATRRKKVVQMGYMFRYNPAFQFLYRALKRGLLGDVFELHGVMSKKVNPAVRKQLAAYPGGTMFELGCHIIDALVRVLGKPDKVTPYTRRTRPDLDQLADNQLAVFEYPKATATIRSAVVEVQGGRRRQFVVCGTKGTIEIKPLEPPALTLTLEKPDGRFFRAGPQSITLPRLGGRYDGDFQDLAQIIRGEKQPDYSPQHDLWVQEALLRASGVPLK